jgi:hypothetical protein
MLTMIQIILEVGNDMKEWFITSPEGINIAPNNHTYENFQVLGFVQAETEKIVVEKLREKMYTLKTLDMMRFGFIRYVVVKLISPIWVEVVLSISLMIHMSVKWSKG